MYNFLNPLSIDKNEQCRSRYRSARYLLVNWALLALTWQTDLAIGAGVPTRMLGGFGWHMVNSVCQVGQLLYVRRHLGSILKKADIETFYLIFNSFHFDFSLLEIFYY